MFGEGECAEYDQDMKKDEFGIDVISKLYHPYDKMCLHCGLKYYDTTDKGKKEQLPCWSDIKIPTREHNNDSDNDSDSSLGIKPRNTKMVDEGEEYVQNILKQFYKVNNVE